MIEDTKKDETKKRNSSPSDREAYIFHPVKPFDIDQPTRDRPHCRIFLLDGEYHTIVVDKKVKAGVVVNEVFRHLELKDLKEKEYFSLYYVDPSGSRIFLNPFKQIRRQIPNASSRTTWELFFGVQFYATELSMLADEMTRFLYVLQMCRDIKEKRINADRSTKLQLVSLLVQANCGDYDPQEHKPGYVDSYIDMIYNPSEIPFGLPNSVIEVHKEKTGFKPNEADDAFFMIVKSLYKFGQQIFPVCDRRDQSGEVGASIVGLVFHTDDKELNIPWQDVITLGHRKKKIRIRYHCKANNDEEVLYLNCSQPNARLVWRGCVEQHTFFRLERPTPLVKNTIKSYHSFNRNSELRFSRGRTLYQMLRSKSKQQPAFQRCLSFHFQERNKDNKENNKKEESITSIDGKKPEPTPPPIVEPKPPPPIVGPGPSEPIDNPQSSTSLILQWKIEEALKQMNNTTSTDGTAMTTVEINCTAKESKSDTEESSTLDCMKVEITRSTPDLSKVVEFSSADKNKSGFMVTFEETNPTLNLNNGIMLEGKYRNDSIIPTDLGPAAQYLLEKSNLKDGTVTATAVNIEVRTPTPTFDEARAELIEELNKELHINQGADVTSSPVIGHEPNTTEEDEEAVFVMRSKLYQFDAVSIQWKECGVGNIKIFKHNKTHAYRILMKRETTDVICANHQLTTSMKLLPCHNTTSAWEWKTPADHADKEAKSKRLALRLHNTENAMKFKEAFEKCQADLELKTGNSLADKTKDEHTIYHE